MSCSDCKTNKDSTCTTVESSVQYNDTYIPNRIQIPPELLKKLEESDSNDRSTDRR